ncbi:MAG: hypothetical protein M0Q51_08330 [Bacteroidales bacterium]|nr:hypothetical protein [Bacteroidales bacterium]
MSKKRKIKNKERKAAFSENDLLFKSDGNIGFIIGFTENGVPYGLTHEEMKELEKNPNLPS